MATWSPDPRCRAHSAPRPGTYRIASPDHESPSPWSDFVAGTPSPGRVGGEAGGPGREARPARRRALTLLYRCADERAVLGPGPVVVPDGPVAEQLGEREPRVARALADPAVGDDLPIRGHALTFVQGLELVGRLERSVLVRRLDPRDVRGRWDVARHLRLFLRQVIGGQLLPPVFLGRADVHEGRPSQPGQDLVAEGPDLGVLPPLDLEPRGLGGRRVLGELAALELPLLPPAVQELHVIEAPELQEPIGVRGEPVVVASVHDD